jgi:hypothetical protein
VVEAAVGPVRAQGAARDSLEPRRLLVLGSAGWETKFIIAALEERGWTVDAQIALAPGGDVAQGAVLGSASAALPAPTTAPSAAAGVAGVDGAPGLGRFQGGRPGMAMGLAAPPPAPPAAPGARLPRLGAIDTARYSAVIAVDSTAGREAVRIGRFVRSGGGLVLFAAAADGPGFRSLAPGRAGDLLGEEGRRLEGLARRDSLPVRPLVGLRADAVVLERRGEHVVTAARRDGVGRVVETGALELWRWRMAGGDGGAEDARAWLARLVAGVAHSGRHPRDVPALDPAPLATLIDHLGQAVEPPPPSPPGTNALPAWIFGVLCGALLLEWLSRRLRSRP